MNKEKTITIPLWEYKFLTQLKKDLIIDMKIEELKREDILKGTVICKAKKCENYLYKNESTSLPGYCWECG